MKNGRLLALIALFLILSAEAHVGSEIGFTSRSVALGGAVVADTVRGDSTYTNPAALSQPDPFDPDKRLRVQWSLIYLMPSFKSIPNVVVQNTETGDSLQNGAVDTEYPDTLGQSFGLGYAFKNSKMGLSLGLQGYLPLNRLALVDSGEAFIPEYFMHRSRTQRPEFALALSSRPSSDSSYGVGVRLGSTMNANTTVFLQNDAAGKVSSMRIAASLKTKAVPYAGAEWKHSESLRFAATARMPLEQNEYIMVHASARAIGTVSALDFTMPAMATMNYDPWSFSMGTSWRHSSSQTLFMQIDYELWSRFKAPTLIIQDPETTGCTGAGCGVQFASGQNGPFRYQNILIPRIGHEWALGDDSFRLGYSFRPTILKDSGSAGNNNLLDPPEHRFSAGYGFRFKSFLDFDTPCGLDLHANMSYLPGKNIVKTSSTAIGAPGYDSGGFIWGGGATLAFAF